MIGNHFETGFGRSLRVVIPLWVFLFLTLNSSAAEPRVLIISIDGLRPDLALRAEMPNLRSLLRNGSYSFWAYTTPAAITLPSHTSMLTGVTIERHGITGNDDEAASKQTIRVPTIFQLAHQRGISTAIVAGKSKFSIYRIQDSIDHSWIENATSDRVADQVVSLLKQYQPRLMLVHFAEVDWTGHRNGWGTPEQIRAIERVDQALGTVLDTLRQMDLDSQTTIILTADHGGSAKQHGKDDDRSRFIPWIIVGPDVRPATDLTLFRDLKINTYDTFATACSVLNIPIPDGIDGKIIRQAFESTDLMGGASPATTTQPAGSK
jgi:predicted AlkP superfamily pyrophosphatase or phosphodiesterase